MPPKKRRASKKKVVKKNVAPFFPAHLVRDVWGVLLVSLSILIFLSVQSYHPSESSWQTLGNGEILNYGGQIGAFISGFLVKNVGTGSYLLAFLIFFSGVDNLRNLARRRSTHKDIGYTLFLVVFCSSIALFGKFNGSTSLDGGLLGDVAVNSMLLPFLGKYGSCLTILTVLVLSVRLIISEPFHIFWGEMRTIRLPKRNLGEVYISPFVGGTEPEPLPRQLPRPKRKTKKEEVVETFVREVEPPKPEKIPKPVSKKEKKKKGQDEPQFVPQSMLGKEETYDYPPVKFLANPEPFDSEEGKMEIMEKSRVLEGKLRDFSINGKLIQVHPGPVITMYEFEPSAGVKVNRIANLSDDLAMAMRATSIRIVAPIPGKAAVGIEIPNKSRRNIYLKEIINSPVFSGTNSKLTVALGKDISGNPIVSDLAKMPHLLVAGATGTGKSVTLNTLICSMLFNASPYELRMVMVDPKMLELGIYEGIPHLLAPVVTDPKKASSVLKWAVKEMEDRYKLLSDKKVRNIIQYNRYILGLSPEDRGNVKPLPYIVMVIDEYADLMMTSSKDVENSIIRLAQMARAVGIHLIIATQRPSVDVITGLIKANFPSRISFRVSSKTDSRTILDSNGAEKLLGKGDMLFMPPSSSNLIRIHGAMVTENEVIKLVDFLSEQKTDEFAANIMRDLPDESENSTVDSSFGEEEDPFFNDAVELVRKTGQGSASMIQRRFRVGYNRAARLVELMEKRGIVGPAEGGKPRKVIYK